MAVSLDTTILNGLFNDTFEAQSEFIGTHAAPIQWVPTRTGLYTVATRVPTLYTEEQGFDPMIALSLEAPSRPVRDQFEDRKFDAKRYSEHYFIDDISKVSARRAGDYSLEERAARVLTGFHRGRHEVFAARLYADASNYGDTDSVTLANAFGAIEDAAATLGGAERRVLVAPPSVVRMLRQSPDFLGSIGGGNTGIVGGMNDFRAFLQDKYGIELLVSQARYVDNKLNPGSNASGFIWEEAGTNWAGVVGLSSDSSLAPSFATTVAFAGKMEDPQIAQLWNEETFDPRGLKVIAESVYDVVVGEASMGIQLTITP